MIAYHGDAQLRADILAELDEHRAQDRIVKGTYGEGSNGEWRGCAVGCAIHSLNHKRGTKHSTGDHSVFETGFGIPRALAFLQDTIFENLPEPAHLDWPMRFMSAPRAGVDLSLVVARFIVWLLSDPSDGVIRFAGDKCGVRESIETVAGLYQRLIDGGAVSDQEWSAARSAAETAAWSAESARSAAETAWSAARSAAWSARSAAWSAAWSAARSAAESARSAAESARSAAETAAYVRMADKLEELMAAA